MIKISSNKALDSIKLDLYQVYESYYEDIDYVINNLYRTKYYYGIQLTPLIQNYKDLIKPEYINEFTKQISYVDKCFYNISILNNNKLANTKRWNVDEIIYDLSEFDCEKLKRNNMKNIINKAFSKSCFRYMCIKTEMLIYILYLIKSNINNIDFIDNIKPFLGGVNYAINKSNNMNEKRNKFEKINTMCRYIWEMTTVFNLFFIPDKLNYKYIPSHHVFEYDKRLQYEDIFGMCWDVVNAKNLDREIIYLPTGKLICKCSNNAIFSDETEDIHDESTSQIINSYTENYKLIIDTIHILLLRNQNISLSQLITLLSNLLKLELSYEIPSSTIYIS